MLIKQAITGRIPQRLPATLHLGTRAGARKLSQDAAHAPTTVPMEPLGTRNGRLQRERELILSVLSSVPSPRETRKFLNSVQASETMRSQRQFAERQAQLTVERPQGSMIHGELLHQTRMEPELTTEVPRRLTAAVFVDGLSDQYAYERAGKLLAQIQRLGVTPIVLVADKDADGYRDVIKRVHRLADAIEREAGRARPLNEGVFYSNPYTDSQLSVDPELIGSAIAQNQIPLISPLVADAKLQLQVLGISSAAPALARALASSTSAHSPMAGTRGDFSLLLARLIFLGRHDGVDARGFQRFVNLEADYEKVYSECLQKDTLALMRQCLGIFPPTAAGIVASVYSDPALVMKGLISEKPVSAQHRNAARKVELTERKMSGTPVYTPLANYPFVKIGEDRPAPAAAAPKRPTQFTLLRHGFQIQSHTDLSTCDLPRLRQLLEDSFKRTLSASAYFSRLQELSQHGGIRIIVAGDYQGAVIVTKEPLGNGRYLAYLDKFAVAPTVQGTGMADILWAQLQSACPECLWRSRSDNGVNPWYFDRAHGHFRAPVPESGTRWVFFWYQQETPAMAPEEIQAGIEVAGRIPASFE